MDAGTGAEELGTASKLEPEIYSMAVVASKKSFFSATIVSVQSCPTELFQVVTGLLHAYLQEENETTL